MSEQTSLAETLADLLKQTGTSQSDLARRSGLSRSYVNELLRGRKPRLTRASRAKLATALGCRPADLGLIRKRGDCGRWTT